MGEWPLTGRAEELAAVVDVLCGDDVRAGAVIFGRPGVGKTRLAHEVAAMASSRGWNIRWITGTAAAQAVPLGAFSQWADSRSAHPVQLVSSVLDAITGTEDDSRVVVAVDDAHLLDDLSAFALHQLASRRAATVIATVRSGHPVPDAVSLLWKEGHLHRLDLQPLSRPLTDALLESVLGGPISEQCSARMWRLSGGNVLFLHALVTQERDSERLVCTDGRWQWEAPMRISPSLADLVELHIGSAPEEVRDVVDVVAVAEPLELEYLSALAEPSAVEEAETRALISVSPSPSGGAVARVAHPLYGEVRLAQAGYVRLARLRGRVAVAMTTTEDGDARPDPIRLGLLWLDSDLPPDAGVLLAATHAALIRMDLILAQRFAAAAHDAGGGVGAQLLSAHASSLLSLGDHAEELLMRVAASGLPAEMASMAANLRAANLLWTLGRPDDSWRIIEEALATASNDDAAAGLLAFRAVQLATAARPAEALALAATIDHGRLAPLPTLILAWALALALGDLGRLHEGMPFFEEAAAQSARSPEEAMLGVTLVLFEVHALVISGHITQANLLAEQARKQWSDVPGLTQGFLGEINGIAALGRGDITAAIAEHQRALDEPALRGNTTGAAYHVSITYSTVLAQSGDTAAAPAMLEQACHRRHPAFAFLQPDELLAAAWVAAARGHISQAQTLASQAAESAHAHGQYAREVWCRQAGLQFGDNHHVRPLQALATLTPTPRARLVARWATAVTNRDGEALLEVSCDLEEMGDRIAAADAAAQAATGFERKGRRGTALAASSRATGIAAECAAVTPATQAAAIPLPLTTRQREIAHLVADGLSNKQIADLLNISVRTIEGHIYQACCNTGITDRAQLGHLVQRSKPKPR
jgi:DNA-binding CsgD family transcriptional regulator